MTLNSSRGELIPESEIKWAFYLFDSLVFDRMSIYHGRPYIAVSQHLLNGADIVVGLQQMGCETMPKGEGRLAASRNKGTLPVLPPLALQEIDVYHAI